MAIVREDTVKLNFEYDDREMVKANDETDKLMSNMQKLGGKSGTGKAEDGFEDAARAAKKFGSTDLSKLSSGIDSVVRSVGKFTTKMAGAAVKGIAVGAAAGTTALVGLGTAAVKSYAEYEQLVGGVETLFGTGGLNMTEYAESVGKTVGQVGKEYATLQKSQNMVLTNANNAYKTAGLSANEYMDTVTSFSASLKQSLGGDTVAAAKAADKAIIDMSDNANKMGTDMSLIQNAYQGFAKQNYTMLDNLKLGYGGTQEEMKRLLKDAEKITGQKYDMSNFADVVEAIHVIQDEMGIAGTTAKEASETIEGSAKAMSAAWQNFIGGMANEDADFDQLLGNLIDSVQTFLKNIIPRIKKMLPRLVKGLTEIAKTIAKELPGILDQLVPSLVDGVVDLMGSMFDVIVSSTSMFKRAGLSLAKAIYKGITGKEMSGEMFASLEKKVDKAFKAVADITKGIVDFGKELLDVVGPALVWIGDLALDAFSWIGDNIDWIVRALGALLGAMLAFKAVKRVTGIVSGFMSIFGKGSKGAGGLGEAAGGSSGGGLFSGFAKMKPTTVLKGMANLAIVIGGLALIGAALMYVAPYMAQLSDGKSFAKVIAVIGTVGLVGTGLSKLAGAVGNIPVATVSKGLANIAIVMGGLALVCIVLGFVAKLDFDYIEMLKLVGIIGAVGLVGSALAGLAGLIGAIPIPVVLTGLANIALALGGITAIIVAFGALSEIKGFDEFISKGGETLTEICRIIGEMAGSLIGGLGEGITNSLPAIGDNLSAFATSVQPMFDTFAGVDTEALKNFATAFALFVGVIAGEKIVSVITGGINYEELGTKLSNMATSLSGFFSTIMTFPDGGFEKATALFNCLANISSLPKEGGIVGWFQGEVNFENMAAGLNQLAGTTGFFTAIQAIPDEAFTKATALFDCLAGIKSLPKDGGVVGWFQGEVNFESIATGIQSLASEGMISALTAISAIPAEAFTSLSSMFDALAGIKAMPKEGGIAGWFSGDSSTGLNNVASQLPDVATNIASFFTNLGGITDFSPISNLFNTLSSITIDTDVAEKGFWSGVSQLGSMGTELSTFATNASTFFTTVNDLNTENVTAFFDVIGKAGDLPTKLEGINGTLGTVLSTMVTTVQTGMTNIKTAITTGLSACVTAITSYTMGFFSSGVMIMSGLESGILSKKESLLTTAKGIASSIKTTIDEAMDINSPSRVTMESGMFIAQGLAKGMTDTIPDVQVAARDVSYATIPYSGNYSPESSSTTNYNGGNSEYTTISPVFNLTISGSQDDRSMARKVKRYVSEAIQDTFESLERKSVVLREV